MADRHGALSRHLKMNQPSKGVLGELNDSERLDVQTTPAGVLFVTDSAGDALENCMHRKERCADASNYNNS